MEGYVPRSIMNDLTPDDKRNYIKTLEENVLRPARIDLDVKTTPKIRVVPGHNRAEVFVN